MINAKKIHEGQYRKCDAYYKIWEIETDLPENEVVEWCFENLYTWKRLPSAEEWRKNRRYGGEKFGDIGYNLAGYYILDKIENGFKFTICKPYDD